MSFEIFYLLGIDFTHFPSLRTYFNANLFQNFFLVALITAAIVSCIYYFGIANIRARYTKRLPWLLCLLACAIIAAIFTYAYPWSAITKAYQMNIGHQPILQAINEGRIKYAFDNLLISAVLYFIISLVLSQFQAHTKTTPIKFGK